MAAAEGEDEALASCYRRAIELCQAHGLASVAFPAISTGVYRFPADRAARIAVSATVDALAAAPAVSRVIFCCFSDDSARLHAQALARLRQPLCRLSRPLHSAAVNSGEGIVMNSRHALRSLAVRRVAGWRGRAAGARRKAPSIFPPARISIRTSCERIGEFFRNEVATGKIPGAIVLIQQHGKPVYHEFFGVQRRRDQAADDRRHHLPPVLDDQADHAAWRR